MKLFMVHVGYYDLNTGEGIYESHLNFFVAAEDAKDAKTKTFAIPEFKEKKMHIDGIKEITRVQNYNVELVEGEVKEEEKEEVLGYDESKEL